MSQNHAILVVVCSIYLNNDLMMNIKKMVLSPLTNIRSVDYIYYLNILLQSIDNISYISL